MALGDHNAFEDLVERAISNLEARPPNGYSPQQISKLGNSVRKLSFPALVVLLAGGSFDRTAGETFLDRGASATSRALGDEQIQKERIKSFFMSIFLERRRPSEAEKNSDIRQRMLDTGLKHLSKNALGTYATDDEIQEIIEILETGRFWTDASTVTEIVYRGAMGVPNDVFESLKDAKLARWPLETLKAISRDAEAHSITSAHRTGSHPVLQETLTEFQRLAPVGRTAAMLRRVLDRDNRSVRLALILYARAHGISGIDDGAIDKIVQALDPEHPDLGPLIREAADRLGKNYCADHANRVVDRL